ncbi:MAG: DUF5063 domain-containing protein [Actinomycetes bacterium]
MTTTADFSDDSSPVAADLVELAQDTAMSARSFVEVVDAIAFAQSPDESLSILLLELSALLVAGAPLGAIVDVAAEAFEPDPDSEPDVSDLRRRLHQLLGPADDYARVLDPHLGVEVIVARLSDDLSDICAALMRGLAHYASGRDIEALRSWQFSYLAFWGQAAACALRAVQSLAALVRADSG